MTCVPIFFSNLGDGFCFICWFLFLCWLFVCMAERNRTPFDFSEGESELVSGFNVEYSGGVFSLIFIFEYGMIIFFGFSQGLSFWGEEGFFFLSWFWFVYCLFLFVLAFLVIAMIC